MKKGRFLLTLLVFLALTPLAAQARVTQIEITNTISPTFGGASFGDVGEYERITGIMYCEADPNDPLNADIVNIDKAPVNERGMVEYDVDFVIVKPIDMKKGNGRILYDTPNRGGALTPTFFLDTYALPGANMKLAAGNGFLMNQGYTIVSCGWQASYPLRVLYFSVGLGSRLPEMAGLLMARLPIAVNEDGSSIVGMSREEYIDPPFNAAKKDGMIVKYLTYPAADTSAQGKSQSELTVRHYETDTNRMVIEDWDYVDEYRITFRKPDGYDNSSIYEFTFPAKDPVVYGLGFASIRDVVSFLRYQNEDDKGNANPLGTGDGTGIQGALAFGASQSGRLIKTFVYEGFNQAENGRKVFDGVNTHIGASRRNWLNGQFSHPGDIFGNDQFPFTYANERDHFTSAVDGILAKCEASDTCPKIMHTDSESEIWSSAGSLVITDTQGTHDVQLPENVRAYMFTGAQHMPGTMPSASAMCQQLTNPLDYKPLLRALLVALDRWATEGIEPPPSQYPNLTDGSLVLPEELAFPDIPAFSYRNNELPAANYNGIYLGAYYLDYAVQPPEILGEYPVYAMQVDEDGNGVAGVRLPDIQVPVATYTGWNRTGLSLLSGDNRLCAASGSFFPFAATKEERLANGDPRLSLEERYPTHQSYTRQVVRATRNLVHKRLLLREDARKIIRKAYRSDIGDTSEE